MEIVVCRAEQGLQAVASSNRLLDNVEFRLYGLSTMAFGPIPGSIIVCPYLDKPFVQAIYRLESSRVRERKSIWAEANNIAVFLVESTMSDFRPSTIDIQEAPPVR
jgi:hypothetical protein